MTAVKTYQEKAVNGLIEDTYTLLKMPSGRYKMVFKAPTGAGKTIVMAAYLNKLCEELPDRLDLPKREAAFIWIAPNQLHLQSFDSLKDYFEELRSIKPIQFEDITEDKLHPNEVLFLNWQSVNKDNNLYTRQNEQQKTLINYINNARNLDDTEIIVILDEAHLFASKGKAAQELLQDIYAKIEIDVSATPFLKSDYGYTIKRPEVIEAEMIKKGVILNPALEANLQHGKSLNEVLLEQALKKREELAEAYREQGVNINPLLLIQLPNDNQRESAEDISIKEELATSLEAKGITIKNHRLAIWLANEKPNLEDIEHFNSITDVLLFKQAIALGWDCPRAAVLLIFREIKQEIFTVQTVGRILRMPQHKHYTDSRLNYGYVYTNLSKEIIQVVQDDMDYIVQNKAIRIKDYQPLKLPSYYINTRINRNRLSSQFRRCLRQAAEESLAVTLDIEKAGQEGIFQYNILQLQKHFIETDVKKIEIPIPKDVRLSGEVEAITSINLEKFAKTKDELDMLFRQFCRNYVGGYAKVDSTPILEMALKTLLEDYLDIDESPAIKIILYEQNKLAFIDIIDRALDIHEELLKQKAAESSKKVEESIWEVPTERIYNEYYKERKAELHALMPFYEYISASKPERAFVGFLETNNKHIEWWYKNGERNKEDFAINYQDDAGITRGFYVDFVIKLKNGTIALFDTKTLDSDNQFCNKHNSLINYIKNNTSEERPLIGGVIVPKGKDEDIIWKYATDEITDANDTSGWKSFNPAIISNG